MVSNDIFKFKCGFFFSSSFQKECIIYHYYNRTPLHEAIGYKRYDVIKFLIISGADLARTNSDGDTPRDVGLRLGISSADLDILFQARSVRPAVNPADGEFQVNQTPLGNILYQ